MWWDIVKSSRNEAYAKFLEEFGPEAELDPRSNLVDDPEYGVTLRGDKWNIGLAGGKMSFRSTLGHEAFVEGMFKEEYPERYQEILDMLKDVLQPRRGRFSDSSTFEKIINLFEEKIRDLGLLDDTDYATVHDMPFTAVLEMALEELKNLVWPPPVTRIKMFNAILDEFMRIYALLQRNRLSYRDLAERRLTVNYRRRALRRLLGSSFVVTPKQIAPREPNRQFLSEVLSIIEVEMNPSGE